MYDFSSNFSTFNIDYVVLPRIDQDELHNKKDLNLICRVLNNRFNQKKKER